MNREEEDEIKGKEVTTAEKLLWLKKNVVDRSADGIEGLVDTAEGLGRDPDKDAKTVSAWVEHRGALGRGVIQVAAAVPGAKAVFTVLGAVVEMFLGHREAKKMSVELQGRLEESLRRMRQVVDLHPVLPEMYEESFLGVCTSVCGAYDLLAKWSDRSAVRNFVFSDSRKEELVNATDAVTSSMADFFKDVTILHGVKINRNEARIEGLSKDLADIKDIAVAKNLAMLKNALPFETSSRVLVPLTGRKEAVVSWARERGGLSNIMVVSGAPGIGKSVLVSMAVREIPEGVLAYHRTLSGRSLQDLAGSLQDLAEDIERVKAVPSFRAGTGDESLRELAGEEGKDKVLRERPFASLIRALSVTGEERPFLLVVDGADDITVDVVEALTRLQCDGRGLLLVTSWSAKSFDGLGDVEVNKLSLDVWTLDESVDHLGRVNPPPTDGHRLIAEALGNYPLAVSQAALLLKLSRSSSSSSSGEAEKMADEIRTEVLTASRVSGVRNDRKDVGGHAFVQATFSRAFEKAKALSAEHSKVAMDLLAAICDVDAVGGVSDELLVAYLLKVGGPWPEKGEPHEHARKELRVALDVVLEATGLVTYSSGVVKMHRLMWELARERLGVEQDDGSWWRVAEPLMEVFARVCPDGTLKTEERKVARELMPHMTQLAMSERARRDVEHVANARLLGVLGNVMDAFGDYRKCKELLERALVIKERAYGPDHVQVTMTLNNLGNAYGDLRDYGKKKELLERVLVIEEREYGPDHVEVAATLVNLGNAYGSLGDYGKQKELLERALVIDEREYGPDHVQVASTLVNLGNAYGDLGDYGKRKELLERALVILEREYGPDHVEVAITLDNLGDAYGSLGDYGKQKELLEQALVIQEREYGPDNVKVAGTLSNLGNAFGDLGDYGKKKELLERALVIKEREYGPDYVQVANTLFNLGNAYGSLGDHGKCKELLERALVIEEREYGPDHVDVAITLVSLGNAYGSLGDYGKQKELLEWALVIKEREYGPNSPQVCSSLNGLGWAAWEFSDSLFGVPLLFKGIAILRSHHPDNNSLHYSLDTHGCLLHDLGRPIEARPLFEEALKLVPSTNIDSKLSYLTHLSHTLITLNTDLPLARAHLDEALTLSTTSQDPKASLEPHLVLARLCLATDAKEEAKTHLEKAQPICDKYFPNNHRFHKDMANLKAKL